MIGDAGVSACFGVQQRPLQVTLKPLLSGTMQPKANLLQPKAPQFQATLGQSAARKPPSVTSTSTGIISGGSVATTGATSTPRSELSGRQLDQDGSAGLLQQRTLAHFAGAYAGHDPRLPRGAHAMGALNPSEDPRNYVTYTNRQDNQELGCNDWCMPGLAKATENLRLVSLGSYCGVRKSVQKIGRDKEALPFDWMRTRIEGILHYLRNDFSGFFDFVTQQQVPMTHPAMVMYRDYYHSFWHDSPLDPKDQEKYRRRFARFHDLAQRHGPETLLFLRSTAHSEEIRFVDDLLQELIKKFGPRVKLLQLVDFQTQNHGPVLCKDRENLLVYFMPVDAHSEPEGAPYAEALLCGIDWASGKAHEAATSWRTLQSVQELPTLTNAAIGWTVHGLETFEDNPPPGHGMQQPSMPTRGAAASFAPAAMAGNSRPTEQPAMYGAATPMMHWQPPQIPQVMTPAPWQGGSLGGSPPHWPNVGHDAMSWATVQPSVHRPRSHVTPPAGSMRQTSPFMIQRPQQPPAAAPLSYVPAGKSVDIPVGGGWQSSYIPAATPRPVSGYAGPMLARKPPPAAAQAIAALGTATPAGPQLAGAGCPPPPTSLTPALARPQGGVAAAAWMAYHAQ
eukprot:TRINITY_DN74803_c0_g1_i1.p1 TRINITY_DN74803_c0_g1~~TRINITY_DN74803_c0_g1_i1.p1  ORF type:complete len:620 (-),score=87.96 TRINITY_DN74803_c0_g1_i1:350-2209(-)